MIDNTIIDDDAYSYFQENLPKAYSKEQEYKTFTLETQKAMGHLNQKIYIRAPIINLFLWLKGILSSFNQQGKEKIEAIRSEFSDSVVNQFYETFFKIKKSLDGAQCSCLSAELEFCLLFCAKFVGDEAREKAKRLREVLGEAIPGDFEVDGVGFKRFLKKSLRAYKVKYFYLISI